MTKRLFAAVVPAFLLLASCTPAEQERAKQKAREAGKELKEELKQAGEEVEEGVEKAKRELEKGFPDDTGEADRKARRP
jgi:F0F1-type ATP synthase membrane subunit b/b'